MKKYIVFVFLLYGSIGYSQNLKDLYNSADKNYNAGNYSEAILYYKSILDYEYNIPSVQLKIANAYRLNLQYSLAEQHYKDFIKRNKNEFPLAYYWLAETQSLLGNQLEASENYEKYLNSPKINKQYSQRARHEFRKTICSSRFDTLITISKDTINTFIHSYGIYSHNSHILYNGINLMSDSTTSNPNFYSRTMEDSSLYSIINKEDYIITDYISSKNSDSINFILRGINDSIFSASLYYTKKTGSIWSELKKNNVFKFKGEIVHPYKTSVNSEDILYFSSDIESGYGGMDIWFATLENGSIKSLTNAGPNINTEGDDICPFYYEQDSCLYYSSNWKNSMGGFDVFKAEGEFMNWEESYNIGRPINSSYNELYYKIHDSVAYFTSNKEPTYILGEPYFLNNVYFYAIPKPLIQENKKQFNSNINGINVQFTDSLVYNLYFDNEQPTLKNKASNYEKLYLDFVYNEPTYIKNNTQNLNGVTKYINEKEVREFFTGQLQKEFELFTHQLDSLNKDSSLKATIYLEAFTSVGGSMEYNSLLAGRRLNIIEDFINETNLNNSFKIIKREIYIPEIKGEENIFDISVAKKRKVKATIYIN